MWRAALLLAGVAAIAAMIHHDAGMVMLGLIGLALSAAIFGMFRGVRRLTQRCRTGTEIDRRK